MVKCKEATYRITRHQHGKISFFGRLGMYIHLLYCRACRMFRKQSRFIDGQASLVSHKHHLTEAEKNLMKSKLRQSD